MTHKDVQLPAEGHHPGWLWCKVCGPDQPLRIEHRWVWRRGNGHPGAEVQACSACGCAALEITTRLFHSGPAAVAGVMLKVTAKERPVAVCVACEQAEPVMRWPWAVCDGCDTHSRAHCPICDTT